MLLTTILRDSAMPQGFDQRVHPELRDNYICRLHIACNSAAATRDLAAQKGPNKLWVFRFCEPGLGESWGPRVAPLEASVAFPVPFGPP